jgi:hypothetical protein
MHLIGSVAVGIDGLAKFVPAFVLDYTFIGSYSLRRHDLKNDAYHDSRS